jgi:glycosyltransferase involved in cell wall biosynthesis
MRVTLLCADLSSNALSRTALLAEILASVADVTIVGTRFQKEIWAPAATLGIPIRDVGGASWPLYGMQVRKLLKLIDGDVVISRKQVLSGFGVALKARKESGIPIVLDIDDDELAFKETRGYHRITALRHPNNRITTAHYTARTAEADAIMVASYGLQRVFGGALVPHAKNTDVLRPQPELRAAARTRLGLGAGSVVMFMGTLRPHKGIEDLALAAAHMRHSDVTFAVVGAADDAYAAELRKTFPRLHFAPPYDMSETGFLLQAADAVVVPQRDTGAGRNQLPAKLLDAMAVALPVVGTAVSDIPMIIGEDRGWLVPPGDPPAIACALDEIFDDSRAAAEAGKRAREWIIENASYDSVRASLLGVISSAVARRARSGVA